MISSVCKVVCQSLHMFVCVCSIQFFLLRIMVCNSALSDLSLALMGSLVGQSDAVCVLYTHM